MGTTYPFSKNNSSSFPTRASDLPSHGLLTRFSVSGTNSLRTNQRTAGHPHNSHSAIPPVSTSCLAGQRCSSRDPQLVKTTDDFSLGCMALSGTMTASQQGGFRFSFSLISQWPTIEACGVFTNSVLPRALTKDYIVWGPSKDLNDQQLTGRNPTNGTGVFL